MGREHHVDREFRTKAGAAGLLCLELPEQYGGGDGNLGHEAVVTDELHLAGDSAFKFRVHAPICAHYIYAFGTDEQKSRWLPRVTTGEAVLAIAMTEPGTGSNLQAVRTTAVRDGDDYVVNGSKTFISNATHCDLFIIVAKPPSQGAKGISLLVAETNDLPGFERGRVLKKIGQWAGHPGNVVHRHAGAGEELDRRRRGPGFLPADEATTPRTPEHRGRRCGHG